MERATSLGVRGETSGLRETLSAQQELLHKLRHELDAEREASATAASEALAMILRLQGEKAALEMEASQYKRMAEEKMCHAETSLALFEDLIYQKEMEIASLEFQVQAYRCRLLSLGYSDPAVLENKFPENLFFLGGEPSAGNQKRNLNRLLSSPLDGISNDRSPLLSDIESLDEKKSGESSVSPPGDLNAYWEQIKRIDEHVRGISDSRDHPPPHKFSMARRESMSHALVSQVSNAILETAKSDISCIMEKMKNSTRDTPSESPPVPSSNVQDIFEVPRSKESLSAVSEDGELNQKNMEKRSDRSQKMKELERRLSKPPMREMGVVKTEHLSLLKEIKEQLNVMQSEMRSLRSELRQQPRSPPQEAEEGRALQSLKEAIASFWL
ncbi:PREDICTED: myosin-binding protein 7 isoform X2 [Tarenaya hassleriana]|uniref:myosin-binding protein 7 isoform X2 n=1 Tax=Tarenaya hassleriana TaxID=28532 RepID=UPI00053C2364|nr:PREDICTED: myosin-binding protein 7 isoform X2 [Tarenaya hassleriana]